MSRNQKIVAMGMTVLAGIAIYAFFAFAYPYHLHFQEQYQLFESTWAYFADVAALPGGLADWMGRYLTQFCYYAPAGAALLALLLCAVQLLCWAVCQRKTLIVYVLSFLPSILLLAFYCDENALFGGAFALGMSLGVAALCRHLSDDFFRPVLEFLLVPVLYMACGPLALVYVLIVSIHELFVHRLGETMAVRLGFFICVGVMAVLSPWIAGHIFPYPLERFYTGVHYYRYHNLLPGLLWLAALASVIVYGVSCLGTRQLRTKYKYAAALLLFVLMAASSSFLTSRAADASKEEWMRYDFMVRMKMWNRIMLAADAKNPDNPKTVSCLNLALSQTGRMSSHQFDYFQNGPDGLLPPFVGNHTNPVSTGEIFWHLGMVNTAQRYAFESQEAIPDFQKSARLYQRLAETNIVNGDEEVARKYLKALRHARFYRRWADETLALLDAGTVFGQRPELARARNLRLKEHDFLFSDTEMDSMLGLLQVEHPDNAMALDYLLSWCLLKKDLDRFAECLSLVKAPELPPVYQEALMLRWVLTHHDMEGFPPYISLSYLHQIEGFIKGLQAGRPEEEMYRNYGQTYWFYYYYRYRTAQ